MFDSDTFGFTKHMERDTSISATVLLQNADWHCMCAVHVQPKGRQRFAVHMHGSAAAGPDSGGMVGVQWTVRQWGREGWRKRERGRGGEGRRRRRLRTCIDPCHKFRLAEALAAVPRGQVEVEQDQVRLVGGELIEGFLATAGLGDVERLVLEVLFVQRNQRLFVFDEQYFMALSAHNNQIPCQGSGVKICGGHNMRL